MDSGRHHAERNPQDASFSGGGRHTQGSGLTSTQLNHFVPANVFFSSLLEVHLCLMLKDEKVIGSSRNKAIRIFKIGQND